MPLFLRKGCFPVDFQEVKRPAMAENGPSKKAHEEVYENQSAIFSAVSSHSFFEGEGSIRVCPPSCNCLGATEIALRDGCSLSTFCVDAPLEAKLVASPVANEAEVRKWTQEATTPPATLVRPEAFHTMRILKGKHESLQPLNL